MNKNYKVVIYMIAITCIFVVSCKPTNSVKEEIIDTNRKEISEMKDKPDVLEDNAIVDLGKFKGLYSSELESQAKLNLMISNQSLYEDSVNLSIYIDKKLLVEDTYLVKDQHNYLYYYIVIEEGEHDISVEYNGKIIGEETIEIVNNKPTWVSLNYWNEKKTKENVNFYISDEPILID